MIEISFGKLLLLGIVALIVLGPERLPHAARTAGALLRRVRNGWDSVRSEVEREIQAEEIRRTLRETADSARATHDSVRDDLRAAGADMRQTSERVRDTFTETQVAQATKDETPAVTHDTPPEAPRNEPHDRS
ncbi:MAG: Sec-independent protein translocase protein TatB [Luteibacter sp.]|uniref:Sec-independent protein translocase protein TatB n=1 Tax=Luteibacter sp. TaxID=1886636 RepID=UPI0013861711|nr:Sec-independent protein translocase protein TatB [Luteibacter sp.]KAF1007083.1 MAG: Sec-independent protein translocase protein TatB [Luteibacter sp.]